MKKNSGKGAGGWDAQQKTERATASIPRLSRHQRANESVASRKIQRTNAGTDAKGKKQAEGRANQKVGHSTHGAEHKLQRQERLDRRRQYIIGFEDHTPPPKPPRKKTKTSSTSPTDESDRPSNSQQAKFKPGDPNPTSQTSPPLNLGTKRSSIDHLIETAPEAHKDGYRAMKYSNKVVDLTYTIQSENPGVSVFDEVVEHLDTVQNELEWIMEQSRRDYDAEVGAGGISPIEKDGKRGKRVAIEDDSDAPVKTRAGKRIRRWNEAVALLHR
ncbi:hypothetical protein KC345_g3200 [Hortaea werneckii]|nr:hypothetical protein KC345_g3200 [Hortaea werneckii]